MSDTNTVAAEDVVQTLYLSLLGRAADPEERDFLTRFVDLGNTEAVAALGRVLISSDEFRESDAAAGAGDYVRAVFQNLFDRAAGEDELERWTAALDERQVSREDLPSAVLETARESDIEAYEAKLFIADYFTDQMAEGGFLPDTLTIPGLTSNEDLYAELTRLDAEFDTLSLRNIGQSLDQRPLFAATVGTGERELLFVTQQHGDEPIGTEAALWLLDFLSGDTEAARELREQVTVTIVPRVNPDGFARWEREVAGEQGILDPRVNNEDIDLNRTYDPSVEPDRERAPESAAIRDLVAALDPDLVLDYHGQGNYRDAEGDLDTMSVLWPTNPGVDPAIVEASKRAVAVIARSLEPYEHDQLTLYPGADNPAIARNGFSLAGVPGVLVEQRFSQEMFELSRGLDLDYSALISALALEGFITMKALVEAAADGSLDTIDPMLAEAIPQRSPAVRYENLYSDDPPRVEETLIA